MSARFIDFTLCSRLLLALVYCNLTQNTLNLQPPQSLERAATTMSQSPNSPRRTENNQPIVSALTDYKTLTAAGAFEPSSSLAPVHTDQWMNAPKVNIVTPSSSAYVPYIPPRLPTNDPPATSSIREAPAGASPRFPPSPYRSSTETPAVYGSIPGGHMPSLSVTAQQPLRPLGLTREMICARVRDLLNHQLAWSPAYTDLLCCTLSHSGQVLCPQY
jgi:hypothetical protein